MDQKELWERYQTDPSLVKTLRGAPRFRRIIRNIPPGARVLNIGIGDGDFEAFCVGKKIDIFTLDPGENSVLKLRQRLGLGDDKIKTGTSEKIPFSDNFFDFVVACELFEHLNEGSLAASLGEIFRVLKPGGIVAGTTPAEEDLSVNTVICLHCGKTFHRWGHARSFSKDELFKTLSGNFGKVAIKRAHFSEISSLNWKGRISYFLKKTAILFGVYGKDESWFFTAEKK